MHVFTCYVPLWGESAPQKCNFPRVCVFHIKRFRSVLLKAVDWRGDFTQSSAFASAAVVVLLPFICVSCTAAERWEKGREKTLIKLTTGHFCACFWTQTLLFTVLNANCILFVCFAFCCTFGNAFVFLKMLNFFKSVNYFPERATVIFSYNKQTTMLIAFDKIHLYIVDYNRHVVLRIARKKELFVWSAGLNMRDM